MTEPDGPAPGGASGWDWTSVADDPAVPVDLQTDRPHSARMYDYPTVDFSPVDGARAAQIYRSRGVTFEPRDRAAVTSFFDGLDLVEPGIQPVHRWRADDTVPDLTDAEVSIYGGVGRKN